MISDLERQDRRRQASSLLRSGNASRSSTKDFPTSAASRTRIRNLRRHGRRRDADSLLWYHARGLLSTALSRSRRDMTTEEIAGDYEDETGAGHLPDVRQARSRCHPRGAGGRTRALLLGQERLPMRPHNAVILEYVARMAAHTLSINARIASAGAASCTINIFLRKHGTQRLLRTGQDPMILALLDSSSSSWSISRRWTWSLSPSTSCWSLRIGFYLKGQPIPAKTSSWPDAK